MGELVFIGLGLHDEKGVTLRGLEDARGADVVFAELYTSTLASTSLESVERLVGKKIRILGRAEVEDGRTILDAAAGQRDVPPCGRCARIAAWDGGENRDR